MNGQHTDAPPIAVEGQESVRLWSLRRMLLLVAVCIAIATTFLLFREHATLANLARHEVALRAWGRENPVLVYVVAFCVYALGTTLLPSATIFSLSYAWYFGFWRALILVSFASTSGATMAFLLSRYLFRDVLRHRYGERLVRINSALEREGAWYLGALRLTPVVPFFVVNTMLGLTPMRTRTFWWVSQLGMLPGTAIFVYAGASAPSLRVLAERGLEGIPAARLLIALSLLGCFPLVARAVARRLRADGDAAG